MVLKKRQDDDADDGPVAARNIEVPGFFLFSSFSARGSMRLSGASRRSRRSSAGETGAQSRSHQPTLNLSAIPGSGSARGATVLKQGQMQKRARHVKVWQTRWVVLEAEFLSYYDDAAAARTGVCSGKRPKGVILLQECSARPGTEPLAIELVTPSRNYHMRAPDEASLQSWLRAINDTAARARGKLYPGSVSASDDGDGDGDDDDDGDDDGDDLDDDESVSSGMIQTPRGELLGPGGAASVGFAGEGWRVLVEGWLRKRGMVNAKWKARWCVLAEEEVASAATGKRAVRLFYLMSCSLPPSQSKGSIDMRTATAVRLEDVEATPRGARGSLMAQPSKGLSEAGQRALNAHAEAAVARAAAESVGTICVVTQKRVWQLRARHLEAHQAWLGAIQRVVQQGATSSEVQMAGHDGGGAGGALPGSSVGAGSSATQHSHDNDSPRSRGNRGSTDGWTALGTRPEASRAERSSLAAPGAAAAGGGRRGSTAPGNRASVENRAAAAPHLTRC